MSGGTGCHFCGKTGHFIRDCPQKEMAHVAEDKGGKVFVGNLRRSCSKDELEEVFSAAGQVLQIWIARDPPGFAFVTYADSEDAREACRRLNGVMKDCTESGGFRVEVSTSPGPRTGGGRGRSRSRSRRGRRDSRSRSRGRRGGRRGRDSRSRRR